MELITKNGPHGFAVTLPLAFCLKWKLKAGNYMLATTDGNSIRFKKVADPVEQLKHDPLSYADYLEEMELAELEIPELSLFRLQRSKRK
jgi:hypothetical protein